jgi:hypothetical protein
MLDSDFIGFGALLLVVWWILASFAVCLAAGKRGREKGPWFFLSLFLGPFFALLLLIAYPKGTEMESEAEGTTQPLSITRGID